MLEDVAVPATGPALRERRDPRHQAPDAGGRRATDPCWTPTSLAPRLAVSASFIRNEILEGRLAGVVMSRRGRKTFRVTEQAFQEYLARFRWVPQRP